MSFWIWISVIVIVVFVVILIISFLIPDNVLERTSFGRVLKEAKNCCERMFKRKERDDYDLGFLRR